MTIENLPFRKYGTSHWKDVREYKTTERLILEQWIIPVGTILKLKTSRDFGYVVLPENTEDERGFIIPKRIFRY